MSNKTQLQTNNNALDALITRVNAAKDVAASLPEAGSGGGGSTGGVEYEIITIPSGAISATYTLPRVTNAYGAYNDSFKDLDSAASTGYLLIGICDTLAHIITYWSKDTLTDDMEIV
jgi:hypothetical protein